MPPPYKHSLSHPPQSESLSNDLPRLSANASSQHKIVIGVDFGTTFTGVSWASTAGKHVKSLADVNIVNDWPGPGRQGDYAVKTPSRIAYGSDNNESSDSFGFEVTTRMQSYAWMKLLLDPEQANKFDDPSLLQTEGQGVLSKPWNKFPVELCADFLAGVAKHAHSALARRLSMELLENTPLEFWFSVPAVWSDRAKADTLRAAQIAARMAGLKFTQSTDIFLIREPEAAAIATISALSVGGSEQLIKPGDSVLVCDCGGGTVDVTSYQIKALTPKLIFKELIPGTGGKCGSTYVDREFIKWLERTFGDAYKRLNWEKRGPSSRLMKEFEKIKRDFGKPKANGYYELECVLKDAPDSDHYDADDGIINITVEEMRGIFFPVIDKIKQLLQSQFDAEMRQSGKVSIKTVLLVGGFGDSVYLDKIIGEECRAAGVQLICPENPQAAIVRGAALAGLMNIQPTSRRARRHYGFALGRVFDPARHFLEDRYTHPWYGTDYASGCMIWKLFKGDSIDEHTSISHSVEWTFDVTSDHQRQVRVYFCDLDDAPDHIRHQGVRKLVTFDIGFNNANLSRFKPCNKNGRLVRKIKCKYCIHFGARRGVLEFSCTVNGQSIGKTTVTFDGQDKQATSTAVANDSSSRCVMQ